MNVTKLLPYKDKQKNRNNKFFEKKIYIFFIMI